MIKPLCKLCGARHFGLCAAPVPVAIMATPAPVSAPPPDPVLTPVPMAPVASKRTRAPNGTFDRTAYQRELMRKRRAAAKAAKENA